MPRRIFKMSVLAITLHVVQSFAVDYALDSTAHSGCVVITGASTGLGRAAALQLATRGVTVFAGVRREQDAEELVKLNSAIQPIILDVQKQNDIDNAVEVVSGSGTPLLAVVNNAGVALWGVSVEAVSEEDLQRQTDVLFHGPVRMTQAFLPLLRESKGNIVNIGSTAGTLPGGFYSLYGATKKALQGFSDGLRRELRGTGISVVYLEPAGITDSSLFADKSFKLYEDSLQDPKQEQYRSGLAVSFGAFKSLIQAGTPIARVVKAIEAAVLISDPTPHILVGGQAIFFYYVTQLPLVLVDHIFALAEPLLPYIPSPILQGVFALLQGL